MTQKRQPKGIPTGGEFAKNEHGEADGSLSGVASPTEGWTNAPLDDERERFDATVVSPDGTRYQVRRLYGGVTVTMTDSEGREGIRKYTITEGTTVDQIMSGRRLRKTTKPPLSIKGQVQPHADFADHAQDEDVVDALVRQSILRDVLVRTEAPVSARWLTQGDVTVFGTVESVDEDEDGVAVHYRDGKTSLFAHSDPIDVLGTSTAGRHPNLGLAGAEGYLSRR